jgi:hypothetical protein
MHSPFFVAMYPVKRSGGPFIWFLTRADCCDTVVIRELAKDEEDIEDLSFATGKESKNAD